MSGVEVAGLVLGAFPIAAWALKQAWETKKTGSRWHHFAKTYAVLWNRLELERILLRQELERLLRPMLSIHALREQDLESLLADAADSRWDHWTIRGNEEFARALRDRLGFANDAYLTLLRDLVEEMANLWIRLKGNDVNFQRTIENRLNPVDSRGVSQLCFRANMRFQKRRTTLTLKRLPIEEHLQRIEACNRKLRDLSQNAIELWEASNRKDKEISNAHPEIDQDIPEDLIAFWEHADRIYRLMAASWQRPCQSCHYARVWLEYRPRATELRLRLLSDKPGQRAPSSIMGNTYLTSRGAGNHPGPVDVVITADCVQQAVQDIIGDLCSAMQGCSQTAQHIGYLVDLRSGNTYAVLSQAPVTTTEQDWKLSHVLEAERGMLPPRSVRFNVALAMASSYLQFCRTAWIGAYLLDDHVRVTKSRTGNSERLLPFVEADFTEPWQPEEPQNEPSIDFAIILLELCFGHRLAQNRHWHAVEEFSTAEERRKAIPRAVERWAADVHGEAGPAFQQAVNWCLHPHGGVKGDARWRRQFAKNVVMPLQKCCTYMER